MSESSLLGQPFLTTYKGTELKVGLITGKVKAEFERRFAARAKRLLERDKALYRGNKYLAELRHIREKEERGEYSFSSIAGAHAIDSDWGKKLLLELLTADPSYGWTPELRESYWEECQDDWTVLSRTIILASFPKSLKQAKEMEDLPFSDESTATNADSTS